MRERLTLLGLDPSVAEEMVRKSKQSAIRKQAAPEPFYVNPQAEWEEAKKRVYEQAQRLAKILLNNVGLQGTGTEIPYKYKSLRLNGKSNFVCALMMVNKKMQDELGTTRQQASTEDFQSLLQNLDQRILQPLVKQLHKAKTDYEQRQQDQT